MIDLNEVILAGLQTYGAWALGAATLISALGLPLPATMLLLAAGAFMQQGVLNWQSAVVLAALGAVLGDSASYLLGRFGGARALRRVQATATWHQAQGTFQRWGGLSVFLSRFLLTPLALPVNLIAGSARYTFWRFLRSAAPGEVLWVLIFSGLGYAFADQWQALSEGLSSLSTGLAMISLLAIGGWMAWHRVRSGRGTLVLARASESQLSIR